MKKFIKSRNGMTLPEAIIGASLSVLVGGMAIWFLVEGTRTTLKTTSASTSDLAEWGILTSITVDTKIANGMVMYPLFTRAVLSDNSQRLQDSQFGNVLVLTKTAPNTDPSQANSAVFDQITGYVFDPTYHTFKKFVYVVQASEKTAPDSLETILNNNFDTLVMQPIAENVWLGTATGAFLCRSRNNKSGELNVEVQNGANITANKKLVQASFFIRG